MDSLFEHAEHAEEPKTYEQPQAEPAPKPEDLELPEKVFVEDLSIGDPVESIFAVTRLNLREFDRGKFLTLRLSDKSGKISAVLWEQAEAVHKQLKEGGLVQVRGKVNSYQNEPQIALQSIHPLEDTSQINPQDFLPLSPIPLEQMVAQFDERITSLNDPDYKRLLLAFRSDPIWEKFITAPGAKLWHHPYIHGLLEHTLSVVNLCLNIAPSYPPVNPDLLVTGAIFHDLGKSIEFDYKYRIDYSTEGRLLGHIYIGASFVERLIDSLDDFPFEKRKQLLHMILSHHGETDRSPILPMTLEANLLHHIENMDAQMMAFMREMNKAREESAEWTSYVNLIERYLYLGEKSHDFPSDAL